MIDNKYFFYRHDLDQSIYSIKTKIEYPSTLFALLKGEAIKDLTVKWFDNLNFNWTIDDQQSLQTLYTERLKQIKKEYEHLELWWSGGYDSNNILDVAVKSNISLDSIIIGGYGDVWGDKRWLNHELQKNKKHLDRYCEKFPKTKVIALDYKKLIPFQNFEKDKWLWAACSPCDYSLLTCYADYVLPHREKYKTVSIYGSGEYKPLYNKKFNIWSFYKTAQEINNPTGHFSNFARNLCFYDTPTIIRQQVHTIKNRMNINDPSKVVHPSHTDRRKIIYENHFPTVHIGNDDDYEIALIHPKQDWYYNNERLPIFNEYWKWCDWVNSQIPKECLRDPRGYEYDYLKEDHMTKIIDIS